MSTTTPPSTTPPAARPRAGFRAARSPHRAGDVGRAAGGAGGQGRQATNGREAHQGKARTMTNRTPTRRTILRGTLATLAVPLVGPLAPRPARASDAIIAALRGGGHVVYFRHGATTWSGIDRLEWPRERQRLLSEEGIRQSEIIGAAFRRRAIPVGDVLASPFARCRDMAEIAFGRVDERMELIGLLSDDRGRAERTAFLRELVTTPPADGANRVIVAHRSNIAAVADVALEEGEAVALRPGGAGGFATLGTLMPGDW